MERWSAKALPSAGWGVGAMERWSIFSTAPMPHLPNAPVPQCPTDQSPITNHQFLAALGLRSTISLTCREWNNQEGGNGMFKDISSNFRYSDRITEGQAHETYAHMFGYLAHRSDLYEITAEGKLEWNMHGVRQLAEQLGVSRYCVMRMFKHLYIERLERKRVAFER